MKRSASALEGPPGWDVIPVSFLQYLHYHVSLDLTSE